MIQIIVPFALFASAISVNKLILRTLPPILFVGVRMLLAGIIMAVYFRARGYQSMHWRILRPRIIALVPIALATMYVPAILKAYGLKHLTSSKLALIGSLDPFITALYGYILWGQRLRLNHILGIFLGFAGVFTMIIYTQAQDVTQQWWIFSLAEVAALGSVCISRLGWIGVQKTLQQDIFQPADLNSILMLIGGSASLITAWYTGETQALSKLSHLQLWGLLAYTVIAGNMLSYAGYGYMLRKYPVTFVSLAGLLVPLFVHMYGPLLLGESLSAIFFIALAVVGSGLWIFNQTPIQSSQQ